MNSQPHGGGTFTALCMLIPLVAVPYFAIRGTKDLPAGLPPLNPQTAGEEVEFADSDWSEGDDLGGDMGDAPPFPSDDSEVKSPPGDSSAFGSDPFASGQSSFADSDFQPSDFSAKDSPGNELDEYSQRAKSGLGAAQVTPGGSGDVRSPPGRNVPTHTVSATTVPAQWNAGIEQLKAAGMRNHRVESLKDRSVYYVTAFFPNGSSGVTRRFEGEGPHPLTALQSVLKQVRAWKANNSW